MRTCFFGCRRDVYVRLWVEICEDLGNEMGISNLIYQFLRRDPGKCQGWSKHSIISYFSYGPAPLMPETEFQNPMGQHAAFRKL